MRRLLSCLALLGAACSSPDVTPPPDGSTTDGTLADASGNQDADAARDAGATDPIVAECVTKINAYRAKVSAPPVTSKTDQAACAVDQATQLVG